MIRPLTEADRAPATALLSQEQAMNLYFLGNMISYGFETAFCQFWGDFGPDGLLRGVLNRYRSGWIVYGSAQADWAGLARVVDQHPQPAERLQDNPGGTDSFLPFLRRYRADDLSVQTLMTLDEASFQPVLPKAILPKELPSKDAVRIRRATEADLARLVTFYAGAEKMSRTARAVADPLQNRRIWLAEAAPQGASSEAGAIRSAALTNAEIPEQAMIGGVFTPPAWRGRGYSQAVVSSLCEDLLHAGMQPVLYWETPAAGAVYRKIGFKEIGEWRAVRLARIE